jgi:hypothetical protein
MGIEASDAYVGWRNGGAPDIAAIECAEPSHYQTLIEPELRNEPPLPAASADAERGRTIPLSEVASL